jgi:hypothetical protein
MTELCNAILSNADGHNLTSCELPPHPDDPWHEAKEVLHDMTYDNPVDIRWKSSNSDYTVTILDNMGFLDTTVSVMVEWDHKTIAHKEFTRAEVVSASGNVVQAWVMNVIQLHKRNLTRQPYTTLTPDTFENWVAMANLISLIMQKRFNWSVDLNNHWVVTSPWIDYTSTEKEFRERHGY